MTVKSLASYHLLGRSGLRVSPLCLGTMTFGTEWGWGSDEATARAMLSGYLEAGGNFVDTADLYTNGRSEEFVGRFLKDLGARDRVVLATKFTFNSRAGDPNAGGNGRKHILSAVEGSLRRLGTDYIDLYWLHAWDTLTPVEEVVSTLDALVRQGKIRYVGLSDTPAWYAARYQTLAAERRLEPAIALQLEYSLTERNIEREHTQVALELGMGICPWSPLAGGFLTGKYQRDGASGGKGTGRLETEKGSDHPAFQRFTERNWRILDVLTAGARELGKAPAEVALNWVAKRPGVASTIIGATRPDQLEANLHALDFDLPEPLRARLEEAGRPELVFPYVFFSKKHQEGVTGGVPVVSEPAWFRG